MENTKMVTYAGNGKRIIMSTTKRHEIAEVAATKATNIVEQNFLFDEEVGAELDEFAPEDKAFTYFAIGSFSAAVLFTATMLVNTIGGF